MAERTMGGRLVACLCFLLALLFPVAASATEIQVSSTEDLPLSAVGGGCGLRQAVEAAQADAVVGGCPAGFHADKVLLRAGDYQLSIHGNGDDLNLSGDLDVRSGWETEVMSASSRPARIIGDGQDRVWDVKPSGRLRLENVVVTGGVISPGVDLYDVGAGIGNSGLLDLDRVAVVGNRSAYLAGGIAAGGQVRMKNTTIAGNWAGREGGGLLAGGESKLEGNNVTIVDNSAGVGAGGLKVIQYVGGHLSGLPGSVALYNSILAGNEGPLGDCDGSELLLLNSVMIGQGDCLSSEFSRGVFSPGWTGLGELSESTGTGVVPLLVGSPAVGAGWQQGGIDCEPVDQLGNRRGGGRCDLGAVQYQGAVPFPGLRLRVAKFRIKQSTGIWNLKLKVSMVQAGEVSEAWVCVPRSALKKFTVRGKRCKSIGELVRNEPKEIGLRLDPRGSGNPRSVGIVLRAPRFKTRSIRVKNG